MFEDEWNWTELSSVIPLVEVRRYPSLPWNKNGLSYNPTLTVDEIQSLEGKDGEWKWREITERISMKEVRKNLNLPWDKKGLSENLTLTISDIQSLQLKKGKLCWSEMTNVLPSAKARENLSLELHDMKYLLQDVDGWQDWNWISSVIPIIDVYTHPNLKWNRCGLSANKDIRVGDLIAWKELPPSIYKRWYYPSDVIIM